MKQTAIKRKKGLSRGRARLRRKRRTEPRYDLVLSDLWWNAITKNSKGEYIVCVKCGKKPRTGCDAHHIIPKSNLERVCESLRLSWDETQKVLWDVRNGMAVCEKCHDLHTRAIQRIPRKLLPDSVWEFAREVQQYEELEVLIEVHYPE